MLASICSIRRRIVTGVKLRSRAFTARKRLPSTATMPPAIRPSCRHSSTNCRHAALDRGAVVAAEVGDGLEVGREFARQPHQLDVATRFALQPPARLHLVEIAVDIQLEQRRRMIARTPCRRRARKPQAPPGRARRRTRRPPGPGCPRPRNRPRSRQQQLLPAIASLDETTHPGTFIIFFLLLPQRAGIVSPGARYLLHALQGACSQSVIPLACCHFFTGCLLTAMHEIFCSRPSIELPGLPLEELGL